MLTFLDKKAVSRDFLLTIVCVWAVGSWFFRLWSGVLPHQFSAPVLVESRLDLLYWLLNGLEIVDFFGQKIPSYFLSGVLLFLPIVLYFTRKSVISAYLMPIYSIFLLLAIVVFNSYANIHLSYLDGLLLTTVAFWFFDTIKFGLLWEGLRYYTCWIYASAFTWKLVRGFWLAPEHAKAIIVSENAAYLHQNPDTFLSQILHFLIQNPTLAFALMTSGMLLQGVFWVGFFTKKYDKILFILPFLFHFLTYFLVDVAFAEFLILQLVFLYNVKK